MPAKIFSFPPPSARISGEPAGGAGLNACPSPSFVPGFDSLRENGRTGGFIVKSVYLNQLDSPVGARFVHDCGLPVDILYFASVPQVSLYFRTLAGDDKGVPHALEHLVLGKGTKGKYLHTLLDMTLGESTAATYTDITAYQFNTAGGMEDFYRVLENFLDALLNPDFSDEEIRREVYNLDVQEDPATGKLFLEEKGTVYNEMVVSMEKAMEVNWDQFVSLLYGRGHPFARNQGGIPSEMLSTSVSDIRSFHRSNYRIGPNMGMVAVLPHGAGWPEFLGRLEKMISKADPEAVSARRCRHTVPGFSPAEEGLVKIGAYPSSDLNSPQNIMIGWKPLESISMDEAMALETLLEILGGGETSYLHRDMVDRLTRKPGVEASFVSAFLESPPLNMAGLLIGGVPPGMINAERVAVFRAAVTERIKWLAGLENGSPRLKETAEKAVSLLSSRRRFMLKFMDNPPRFGERSGGVSWHRHLDWLDSAGGFRKSIPGEEAFESLLKRLRDGDNVWKETAGKFGLLRVPYVTAVRPDPNLLSRQKEEKLSRLEEGVRRICAGYGLPDHQQALLRKKEESAALTRGLDERDVKVPRPGFTATPPLTLDDTIRFRIKRLPGGGDIVLNHVGDSPFTDIGLFFDISRVGESDLVYLPLLAPVLDGVGVFMPDGGKLDYSSMTELWRSQLYSLSSGYDSNPGTGRLELYICASASDRKEIPGAVEWIENCLLRNSLGEDSRARLTDLLTERIQSLRSIMQRREENWVTDAAAAYFYQDNPAWMSVNSPFTRLFHLVRLRWMLEEPSPRRMAQAREILEDLKKSVSGGVSRGAAAEIISRLPAEMAEEFNWELSHMPEETWRSDIPVLAEIISSDLGAGAAKVVSGIKSLLGRVLSRGNLRACMTGSDSCMDEAFPLLEKMLAKLALKPDVSPSGGLRRDTVLPRIEGRYPAEVRGREAGALRRPVHAALVNEDTKSGVFVISSKGFSYRDVSEEAIVDFLAARVLGGSGAHGVFMKTWGAGLAYSNGVSPALSTGRIRYYAERCPDLVQTMSFVSALVSSASVNEPFFVEYALANSFSDYRGGGDFSSRGEAMASDLADSITPEIVGKFKTLLIREARKEGIAARVSERIIPVLSGVITGLGRKVSSGKETSAFVIAPESLLEKYEAYLRDAGEADVLIRLHPRDFWITG